MPSPPIPPWSRRSSGGCRRWACGILPLPKAPAALTLVPLLQSLYQTCGMTEVAQRTGAVLNFDTSSRQLDGNGQVTRHFTVIHPIADADLIINICKLKTHCMTVLSGAVKNLFGCVPGLMKPELHMRYPRKKILLDAPGFIRGPASSHLLCGCGGRYGGGWAHRRQEKACGPDPMLRRPLCAGLGQRRRAGHRPGQHRHCPAGG